MEFEFQQQLQQPYFASFPHPSSTSASTSTYALPPSPFIEADATPRRKPFPNKATLTELQQYQEQQQLQVQHHPFPSYSAYPPNFQFLFGDFYQAEANTPHLSQTNVNVDPRQHRHSSYTFSQSQDNLFSYGEPVQRSNSKASKSSRSSRRSKSQYFEDTPSTPVLTVTPRKKRPKSLAAQDFT
ncbi:hypothetical protein BG005_008773, partial [Podila minutissima]